MIGFALGFPLLARHKVSMFTRQAIEFGYEKYKIIKSMVSLFSYSDYLFIKLAHLHGDVLLLVGRLASGKASWDMYYTTCTF